MKSSLLRSWYIFACITLLISLASPATMLTQAQEDRDEPEAPAVPAQLEFFKQLGGMNTAMETQGGYLYLGMGNSLMILSLANPANPTAAGQYTFDEPYPCPVNDLAVSGNYAYVACGDYYYHLTYQEAGGFRVVNISNPSAPVEVAHLITAEVYDIAVNGSYAYVSPGVNATPYRVPGLWIYDISDPANPQKLAELLVSYQRPLYVTGDRLYVGGCVFDISNPAAPIELGCPLSGFVGNGFQFIGDTQYQSYNQGLYINDFSQPLTPTLIGYTYPISATGALDVQDGLAYITGGKDLGIVNVSDPAHPAQISYLQIEDNPYAFIYPSFIKVVAGYAYITSDYGYLRVIDVRDSNTPVLVGRFDAPSGVFGVAASDIRAFDLTPYYEKGILQSIDLHSEVVPEVIGSYEDSPGTQVGGTYERLIVSQNFAFVTRDDVQVYSLEIFDLSNPSGLIKTGSYPTGGYIQNFAVSNGLAYLVENDANNDPLNTSLRILDVSNPGSPASVEFRSQPYLKDVAVRGSFAYLTSNIQITILDVTDPASPVERDSMADIFGDLALGPDGFLYAYIGYTLAVLDVSNPDDILFVKNAFTSLAITDLVVEGDYAFGAGEYGVVALDVTDPANPVQVAERRLDGCQPNSVAVSGSQVLVGTNHCGLIVLEWTPREKTPVILVPGFGASFNPECLLFDRTCEDGDRWDWTFLDPFTYDINDPFHWNSTSHYYDNLIAHFSAAGYSQRNGFLKVHFYDWTNTLYWNSQYLKQTIDQVKAETGASKVDLIGHSMGGLVARAYVQSTTYGDDVAHLVTLGSPHEGLAFAYSPWEGYSLADTSPEWQFAIGFVINQFYPLPGLPLFHLREAIPSIRDLLPSPNYIDGHEHIAGYLYDETNSDTLIPEASMHQRNLTLAFLNQYRSTLLTRTQMTTIAGSDHNTLARYYVAPPAWWEWPHWEDGKPNFNRLSSFYSNDGDNTVLVDSALMPDVSTAIDPFEGVGHGELPNHKDVIAAIFNTLDIPLPTINLVEKIIVPKASLPSQPPLVISLYGSADFTLTDALGRSVGPLGSEIAETKYISDPSSPYKLVLIPHPIEGEYQVQIEGEEQNDYHLGLMNTFNPAQEDYTNPAQLWDTSSSAIKPGATVNYVISYTLATTQTVDLIAASPVIEAPVWITATIVTGRFLPGQLVEIRDADTQAVLGSATSDAQGHFSIQLSTPLHFGQRLVAWSNDLLGVPVKVQTHQVFLPLTEKP